MQIAVIDCLWYGPFGATPGRACWSANPTPRRRSWPCSPPTPTPTERIVERYADRWSIEPANAIGKQLLGVGQARNRLPNAVERTVPFGFLVQTLVIVWYALYGYHPDDLHARRRQPWYPTSTEPAFEDMLAKLRRTLIAARFTGTFPAQPDPNKSATTNWPAPQPPRNCESQVSYFDLKNPGRV